MINQLEEFLDSTQSLPGPFSYVILGPDYETDEVDFFWGNFYQSEEARQAFEAEWQILTQKLRTIGTWFQIVLNPDITIQRKCQRANT